MVERQLRRRGIHDERVLAAMNEVPRELFLPKAQRRRAYRDGAVRIGLGRILRVVGTGPPRVCPSPGLVRRGRCSGGDFQAETQAGTVLPFAFFRRDRVTSAPAVARPAT